MRRAPNSVKLLFDYAFDKAVNLLQLWIMAILDTQHFFEKGYRFGESFKIIMNYNLLTLAFLFLDNEIRSFREADVNSPPLLVFIFSAQMNSAGTISDRTYANKHESS
jgi:hypothetical protein